MPTLERNGLRQTGRTTRIIERACKAFMQGKKCVIVFETLRFAEHTARKMINDRIGSYAVYQTKTHFIGDNGGEIELVSQEQRERMDSRKIIFYDHTVPDYESIG